MTEPINQALRLPFVIAGRRIEARGEGDQIVRSHGAAILPGLGCLEDALAVPRDALLDVPTQEIVGFLHRVGKMWEDDEYVRRRMYVRQMRQFAGYSERMATTEADLIAALLRGSARLWDTLEVELGDRAILDTWVRREDAEVCALPRGLVVHVLAGNVPVAAVLSVLRSLLTKNQTLVKVASGDPITATQLALSFLDVEPDHPVSRSLHSVYWPNDSPEGASLLRRADGVCVWGGADAVAWASRHARPGVEVVAFGPKRSFAVVRAAGEELDEAARLVAHDICMYDQQACFSTQNVFVLGNCNAFAARLAASLERYSRILAPPERDVDQAAASRLVRAHHDFLGDAVLHDPDGGWQVVVTPPWNVHMHPGARTALLHPIRAVEDFEPFVDASVQTVAAYPWELLRDHRERLARRGVSRMVEVGSSGTFRLGATHDGMYPLTRLVRLVSLEAPSATHPKGMSIPLDMSKMVEHRQFRDLFV